MNLQTKRIILTVISLVFGVAATAGVILAFGTTPQNFAYSNVVLLFISSTCLLAIWLDYFMDTQILKK